MGISAVSQPNTQQIHRQHLVGRVVPLLKTASNSIDAMTYRRRAQGAAIGNVALYTRINPEAAAIADAVAERVGLSKAEFVEAVMFHLGTTLDEDGVPTWWTLPTAEAEELDLHAS